MKISETSYSEGSFTYVMRTADLRDAAQLSKVRVKIDDETENMDRAKGEDFIDEHEFAKLILADERARRNLFLVAAVQDKIIGYSRCAGSELRRTTHRIEFGVCVLKDYWGHHVGTRLLDRSIAWADQQGIRKITLNVLETNTHAIALYKKMGFAVEGVLREDKKLSDGNYYSTMIMGRLNNCD
ncbi:GNAT family N-acetyltransferase [Sporolactobacillus shoreicorticis]|uniref:GNAT family N-acetyltransferase n=1 Tax=Sporolactobacillus shoreicorticis TaxID=1923877 RepID=A0ABW5S937_9BACL|nr:GNAT family N-acetyltransferase [Sporolactobacillus shoreicorticis]MCO7127333.1 GNAT family N-acetyltransferase [Sporolactobacillus shoreicorticis]